MLTKKLNPLVLAARLHPANDDATLPIYHQFEIESTLRRPQGVTIAQTRICLRPGFRPLQNGVRLIGTAQTCLRIENGEGVRAGSRDSIVPRPRPRMIEQPPLIYLHQVRRARSLLRPGQEGLQGTQTNHRPEDEELRQLRADNGQTSRHYIVATGRMSQIYRLPEGNGVRVAIYRRHEKTNDRPVQLTIGIDRPLGGCRDRRNDGDGHPVRR